MPKSEVPNRKADKGRKPPKVPQDVEQGVESGQPTGRITASPVFQPKPRPIINYILGSPADDRYQSKCQQKKLVRAATVKAKVNVIHTESDQET